MSVDEDLAWCPSPISNMIKTSEANINKRGENTGEITIIYLNHFMQVLCMAHNK